MCGFAGFLGNYSLGTNSENILKEMGNKISHRGPDDMGVWLDKESNVGFSHRRLAIIDLSAAGHQPMLSACGRYMMSFNGEIYNHLDLRAKLKEQGLAPQWRGHSDTEALLAGISSWGVEETLKVSVGMFAIALWDYQKKTLFLARDRFGEKPLYYGWQNESFIFGSELKALKTHPDFLNKINREALTSYFRYNYIPAPLSIYEGISKLMPGHLMEISSGNKNLVSRPYWEINEVIKNGNKNTFKGDRKEAVDQLETLLSRSISGQMLADVPLGAFLSGGVDSSTVVALMQKNSDRKIRTFAIGFNEEGYNEAEYAAQVAKHIGTDHTELYVNAKDSLDVIPSLPHIYCEPFADSSQIPTFLVSKMARQHVTVALSGDAGDELFGGYNPYQFAPKIWQKINHIPSDLRHIGSQVLSADIFPNKINKLSSVLGAKNKEEFYQDLLSHNLSPEKLVIDGHEPKTIFNSPELWPQTKSFEEWMMTMDMKTYMTDDILVKVDRAAMANSLETRVPMLDHRILEFAAQLPLDYKIYQNKGKWILRELLSRHVPNELIDRPKKGFSIPIQSWLRGPLRSWAEELLDESRLKREGYLDSQLVKKMWSEHSLGKRDHSTRLWAILMFQSWLEVNK